MSFADVRYESHTPVESPPLRAVDRRRFVDLELDQVERVQAEKCRQRKHPDDSGCAEKICSRPHPGGTLGA